ncbi:MAG TPA: DUF6644 family protein [Bryobacteraceae bacterium]|nr:DUF6644 family protein [Bryobacteraceae bacterium]
MSVIADFAGWVANTQFFTALRESGLPYPIVMSTHLSSIAIFGGAILMTDLRILGFAMKSMTITEVVRQTRIWKRIGFVIMISMGILLAGAKLDKYYDNPYFITKLSLLLLVGVHALIFRPRVYKKTEELDSAPTIPGVAKAAAWLSIVLWVGILSMGRWIAYYERPGEVPRAPSAVTLPSSPQ